MLHDRKNSFGALLSRQHQAYLHEVANDLEPLLPDIPRSFEDAIRHKPINAYHKKKLARDIIGLLITSLRPFQDGRPHPDTLRVMTNNTKTAWGGKIAEVLSSLPEKSQLPRPYRQFNTCTDAEAMFSDAVTRPAYRVGPRKFPLMARALIIHDGDHNIIALQKDEFEPSIMPIQDAPEHGMYSGIVSAPSSTIAPHHFLAPCNIVMAPLSIYEQCVPLRPSTHYFNSAALGELAVIAGVHEEKPYRYNISHPPLTHFRLANFGKAVMRLSHKATPFTEAQDTRKH